MKGPKMKGLKMKGKKIKDMNVKGPNAKGQKKNKGKYTLMTHEGNECKMKK